MTHNSRYIAADGHSPYIVSSMKWMMVIIDQGMAYMTGSSNDECEGRQQVDRRVGYYNSFLPFYHSVSPRNSILPVLKGLKNMEIFSVSRLSPSPSILPLCLYAYAQHNCSISSGFSLCYPLKKKERKKRRETLKTGFGLPLSRRDTVLTADIFHASCSKARDTICSATGEE